MKIEELLKYEIPEEFIQKFKEEKITELYPPQADVIRKGLFKERNLVLSLPTASGKTLIATLAIINQLQRRKIQIVYIVPLVALANEKYDYYKKLFENKYKVAISVGDLDSSDPWLADYDLIICTTEKLDSLIRHGSPWIKNIGLIIVDEIHLLNDSSRGPTLEILLTRLREIVPRAQIFGLSATISNADELAKWLNATLVFSDFRPVKLYEGVSFNSKIQFFGRTGYELSNLETEAAIIENTLNLKKQALFFVSTRKSAETLAEKLSKMTKFNLGRNERFQLETLASEIENVLEIPTRQCKKLANCIKCGVAFHHAGLLGKQKRMIEDNFRTGLIKTIIATPTLCLHPTTFIFTKEGVKQIIELKRRDEVLTHQGAFKKVISPTKRKINGELLVLKPFGSLEVKMSPEHRVLILKQIRHKSHYSDGRQRIWWEYKGPVWMSSSKVYEELMHNKDKKLSFMLLQPLPKISLKADKIILKDKPSYVSNQFGETIRIHPADKRTPKFLPLNYEIGRVVGLWIAEGSTSKNGVVKFDIATYETELTKFIISMNKKYFSLSKVVVKDKERHRRCLYFCNKFFAAWLKEKIGNKAYNKKIPSDLFFNQKREVKIGLLRGLIEGDGHVRIDNRKRTHYISYTTVSPTLAYQLQILLASLGYVSYLSKINLNKESHGKHTRYQVRIGGSSYYKLMKELRINKKAEKGNRMYNINKIWNDFLLLKIRNIGKEKYEGEVCNLAVEDDESYSVGFIVHNSLGVNLPAFRVVVRDAKRYYPGLGVVYIPVLEYKQFIGRAGRPQYDDFGESILIAKTEEDAQDLTNHFILGQPEDITSKLALEPILRMHTLALIASEFCKSEESLLDFFSKTFYGFQYGDISVIEDRLLDILDKLVEWKFITKQKEKLSATRIGKRVSELYTDPLTAYYFIKCLERTKEKKVQSFSFLQLISNTIEMRPLLSVRTGEFSEIQELLVEKEKSILQDIPEEWDLDFDEFFKSVKMALLFEEWINEATEDQILTKFRVAPGELRGRLENADWLMYSLQELAFLLGYKEILKDIRKLRIRLQHGIKEELIPLVKLKQVGRIRARRLWSANLRSLEDLRKIPLESLSRIVGPSIALIIKKQLGEKVFEKKEEKQEILKNY